MIEGIGEGIGPYLNPNQEEVFTATDEELWVYGGSGAGKCVRRGTRVVVNGGGLVAAEDVCAGDLLLGPDSKPRRVLSVHSGTSEMYRVTPRRGNPYTVNGEHLLYVRRCDSAEKPFGLLKSGKYRWPNGRYANEPKYSTISVLDYLSKSKRWKRNHLGVRCRGVEYPKTEQHIAPYFLGLWLGDGYAARTAVVMSDSDWPGVFPALQAESDKWATPITKVRTVRGTTTYAITHGRVSGVGRGGGNPLLSEMKRLDIISNKHIPYEYLCASRQQRLELLAGLIDTDGHFSKGHYEITQKNERLAGEIALLAASLGFGTHLRPVVKTIKSRGFSGTYHRLTIMGDLTCVPTRLERKHARKCNLNRDPYTSGLDVEPVGRGEYFGFTLDGDGLFLLYDFTILHNSYTITDKLLIQSAHQNKIPLKAVVVRRTLPSLRATCIDMLQKRANLFQLPFNLNKSDWTAQCGNMQFLFRSCNNKEDIERLKSLTDVDFFWINELSELREADYEEMLRRMRGGESKIQQMICDFNPIGRMTWVYERGFVKDIGKIRKLHYTVLDNHPAYLATPKAQRYVERLRKLQYHNENAYKVYYLGEWGELEGVIFDWDVVPLPTDIAFDEVFYGGDFGYSVDPAAVVKIHRKGDEYWCQELVYETDLTNQQLGKRCLRLGMTGNDVTYWDCAEPKSIAELCAMNLNAIPCVKGPDSVKAGIDTLKQLTIHVVEGSDNIEKEVRGYVWKTDTRKGADNKALPVPIEFNDHAMSAVRYGIYTSRKYGSLPLYTGAMYEEQTTELQGHIDIALARVCAGETVGTNERDWRSYLRDAILKQAEAWEASEQEAFAKKARAEVARLDRVFNQ